MCACGKQISSLSLHERAVGILMSEEKMKKLLAMVTALVLIVGVGGSALAYESDFDDIHKTNRDLPFWKLGRGVVNLFGLPHELVTNMTNESIKGGRQGAYEGSWPGFMAGSLNGALAGMAIGIKKGLERMTRGGLEILTFWKPEYGPTIEPTWGTRSMQFGQQDFYESEPFWDTGPPK